MIGPHQGKELELMLAGKKHLAIFHDVIIEGQDISEEIIPELAFKPYVDRSIIKRFSREEISAKFDHKTRYVFFTMPGHEWRVDAFLWFHDECLAGRRPFDEAYEYFVGRLLDYDEHDIQDFLNHPKFIA